MVKKINNCRKCNYSWSGWKKNPKTCPACKSYTWKIPSSRKKPDYENSITEVKGIRNGQLILGKEKPMPEYKGKKQY